MLKIGDKIKISDTNAVVVKVFKDNTAKIIYRDSGYRILDEIVFVDGTYKFEKPGVSGRKLNDSEYSDFIL